VAGPTLQHLQPKIPNEFQKKQRAKNHRAEAITQIVLGSGDLGMIVWSCRGG